MARISTYTLDTSITGSDKLLGTDGNTTKSYSVGDLRNYMLSDSQALTWNAVNMRFDWSLAGGEVAYSSRTDGPTDWGSLGYPLLKVSFDNLVIEEGSTYSLIIERAKRGGSRSSSGNSSDTIRTSGLKRDTGVGREAPYDARPIELPITEATGQYFDFKFDLFYSGGNGTTLGFPRPSGSSSGGSGSHPNKSKQRLAFRIAKTTSSGTVVSPVINELIMLGISLENAQPRITFSLT
jgi:hypothetical protein